MLFGWFVLFAPQLSCAFWSSDPASLKELAGGVAAELREKSGGVKRLYLDKVNVKDAVSGETSNLSAFLVNEFESALSSAGFSFSDFMEQADMSVGASYQRDGDRLRVFVKYCPSKDISSCKTLSATLLYSMLPKDSFSESIDSRLKHLAQKAVGGKSGLKIFINPVVERKNRYSSEFSEYVTAKARSYLVNSQQFDVLEEQPVTRSLSNTRGLAAKAKQVQNLETSAALFSGADAVLDGYYFEGTGRVTIVMTLKNLKGGVLGSAEETIDRAMIPYNTVNQAAGTLAEVGDVASQVSQKVVKLHTTKGDLHQIYRAGEKLQFLIQVAKPLYVYLYGINTKNEINQLYPGPEQRQMPFEVRQVYTVPGDRDSWEIVVEPPFGTDLVKLFASEQPLPVPSITDKAVSKSFSDGARSLVRRDVIQQELSAQKTINGFDLVDYFKGSADRLGATLYEDSLFVQTRPK
jgi:hypothetical protein